MRDEVSNDLITRLQHTLKVMQSARRNDRPMAVWFGDIQAVENAISALSATPASTETKQGGCGWPSITSPLMNEED